MFVLSVFLFVLSVFLCLCYLYSYVCIICIPVCVICIPVCVICIPMFVYFQVKDSSHVRVNRTSLSSDVIAYLHPRRWCCSLQNTPIVIHWLLHIHLYLPPFTTIDSNTVFTTSAQWNSFQHSEIVFRRRHIVYRLLSSEKDLWPVVKNLTLTCCLCICYKCKEDLLLQIIRFSCPVLPAETQDFLHQWVKAKRVLSASSIL